MKFEEFNISEPILRSIKEMGFEVASPIQVESILPLLGGRDVIGQAQTGTGKTAAFGIPILEKIRVGDGLQALVLCPTRELCMQVCDELTKLSKYKAGLKVLPVYGGTQIVKQIKSIKKGVELIVGTPGRVMDLMRRKVLKFDKLEMIVLDEADEMFDMGFRQDMKFILDASNEDRQTCFYSATMGDEIQEFSSLYQKNPSIIRIKQKEVTVEKIDQYYIEMKQSMKTEILSRLLDIYNPELSIVFCNTKKRVDELVAELTKRGYSVDGLHGDLNQNQRDHVMKRFRKSAIDILVATDVAARGIDVENVDIVFNFDLPQLDEYYVHRIGRTARAGKTGMSFSFIAGRDSYRLKDILKYTKAQINKMDIPSLSLMDKSFENNLIEKIINDLETSSDISKERLIIEKLEEKGFYAEDIAAILLKQVISNTSGKFHEKLSQVDFDKKSKNKKSKEFKKDKFSNIDSKLGRIFINRGKRDGLTNKIILQNLNKKAKIPSKAIGSIRIQANFTFVDLEFKYLDQAVEKMNGKNIGNRPCKVEISEIK